MGRHGRLRDMAGAGPGCMKKCTAGPAGFPDVFLGQETVMGRVVRFLVPDHFHQPGPPPLQSDDLVAFAEGPEGDRPDGRIQPGDVAPAGQNPDDAFFGFGVGHDPSPSSSGRVAALGFKIIRERRGKIHVSGPRTPPDAGFPGDSPVCLTSDIRPGIFAEISAFPPPGHEGRLSSRREGVRPGGRVRGEPSAARAAEAQPGGIHA